MENERVLRLLLRKFGRTSKKVLIKAGRSVKLLWEIGKKFDNTVEYSNYHVVIQKIENKPKKFLGFLMKFPSRIFKLPTCFS